MASKLREFFRNIKDPLKNKIKQYQNCLYKKSSSYFIYIIFTSPNISLLLIEYWMVENFFQFKSRNLSWSWIIIRQGMRFEFCKRGEVEKICPSHESLLIKRGLECKCRYKMWQMASGKQMTGMEKVNYIFLFCPGPE